MNESEVTIISGGAKGVDSIAIEVAKGLGSYIIEYLPESYDWASFQIRNIEIAKQCDILYCISTNIHRQKCYHHKTGEDNDHEKTAGCWTLNQAKALNKKTVFFKV
mgnify:CR=1 FL=1